eukprot:CAMPEP_0113628494 /NCGR_PEP_ID=MMETSP0017_2-20120614/14765_1 /TAXON_ID=2856 /ORGANISM="Cylindrotheca closterium" /LENGTH=523 /DNA_ID=CAMNT_0000538803 /DNA_START=35 /DNA_END=1603 /DNA_ORIENTATION=- /assembly_acc=CAM_ASM_000147
MPEQLRSPSPRLSSSTPKDATIQKAGRSSSMAESDGETTVSVTSSEEESSPPSNVRNVSAQVKGKRVSRTSVSRPEGYLPAKRVSKTSSPNTTPNRQSRVIVKPTSSSSSSTDSSKDNAVNQTLVNQTLASRAAAKRTSGTSKRSSGGWDSLARKSTSYRNSTSSVVGSRTSISKSSSLANKGTVTSSSNNNKGNPKDELIAKLNKQVEMLQEKHKKADTSHQKTTQHLEARLEDLRLADSILIDQLRSERNELKEKLDQANDRIQSIGEEQQDAMQQELAAKLALEQQLAEAHARISKLSEQALDDHFGGGGGGSKIGMLREKRRAIEAQMSHGGTVGVQPQTPPPLPSQPEKSKPKTDVDMEAVIKNLRDELEASKQVIVQQKEQLRLVLESQDSSSSNENETTKVDKEEWKARFMDIQKRHLQLECDRAWSEFKLRNRITNDSLKFNRRLNHWKGEVQELETKLNNSTLEKTEERTRAQGAQQQEQQQQQIQEQQVQEVAPVDNSRGGNKSTGQPPQRGW